jgi:hypothetical protein
VSHRVIYSTTLGLTKMSILIVGEIFSMLTSSNTSGVGIGFLNQSTWPEGMKSLASMVQTGASEGGQKVCEPKKGINDERHPMGNLVHIEPLECLHRIER